MRYSLVRLWLNSLSLTFNYYCGFIFLGYEFCVYYFGVLETLIFY